MKAGTMVFAAALIAVAMVAGTASATPVYFEDFEDYTTDDWVRNWDGGTDWDVISGTVDLVGTGAFAELNASIGDDDTLLDGGTYFVDLDGSSRDAGALWSTKLDTLLNDGQQYRLSFILSGNARNKPDDTVGIGVGVGNDLRTVTLASDDEWQEYSMYFTYAGGDELYFENLGGDNVGALLDNVQIEAVPVPEPASMTLLGLGLAGLGFRRFRKRG